MVSEDMVKNEIDFLRKQRKIYERGNDRFYQEVRRQFDCQINILKWVLDDLDY